MESRITENGINYVLVGDYYIPEIGIKEEGRSIEKYGMLRKQYLKEHKPGRFSVLVMKGELDQHLADVDSQKIVDYTASVILDFKENKVLLEKYFIAQKKRSMWKGL